MSRRARLLALALACAAGAASGAGAGPIDPVAGRLLDTPQVFPSHVELVAVELMVVDGEGRPIRDLGPSAFRLQVGGRPRRVVSAEFVPVAPEPGEAPSLPADQAGFTTNEAARPGRLVLLVVDTANIEMSSGRDTMQAASQVLGRLGPTDRLGLVTIPTSGPHEEFTTDHRRIVDALKHVVGQGTLTGRQASISADTEDWELRLEYERVSAQSRAVIKSAFDALRPLAGQKVVILVSQGLGFPETLEQPGVGGVELRELVEAARASRAAFYVVPAGSRSLLPSIESDIRPPTVAMDRQLHFSGLEMLATDAGGAILRGQPERVFERVLRETSGYYRLGFEPEGDDRDGKPRKLRVAVNREGAIVRARPTEVLRVASPSAAKGDLVATLRSPTLATALPVRVATWSLAGVEPGKLQLLIGAEIGAEAEPHGLAVGYVLLDAKGRVAASTSQPLRDEARVAGPLFYSSSASIVPGAYTLRLAVRDGRGRLGSVEHEVEAGLVKAGPFALGDLLLGRVPQPGQRFRPAVAAEFADEALLVHGEVYGTKEANLDSAAVTLEVVSSETGASVRTIAARVVPASAHGRRVVQAVLPLRGVAPGLYLARVLVSDGGMPRGAVVRPFRVLAAPASGVAP